MGKDIQPLEIPKNLDEILSQQAKALFNLDDESLKILSIIAEKGLLTVYNMEKEGPSRQSIYRRLKGEKDLPSLLNLSFLYIRKTEKFERTNKIKKFYGLTLKGAITVLSSEPFQKVYLFSQFLDKIGRISNYNLKSYVEEFIKAELALILQFHIENGLNLTYLKSDMYFRNFRRNMKNLWGYFDLYSGKLRGIRAEAGKWSHIVDESIMRLEPKIRLKMDYMVFDWPYYVRFYQDSSMFDKHFESKTLPPPGRPEVIYHDEYEDEVKYAKDETKKVLGENP